MEKFQIGKADLRKKMVKLRAELPQAERILKDRSVFDRVMEYCRDTRPSSVYIYVDFKGEVATGAIIEALLLEGVKVAVPRVEGKRMSFRYITSMDQLLPGTWGILEPGDECAPALDRESVVLVPGLAFTEDGKRLGYGGGYYDKFFQGEQNHRKVALAYGFQVLEDLPTEDSDVAMDLLIRAD